MVFEWQINDKLDICVRIKNKPKDILITEYQDENIHKTIKEQESFV